LSLAHFLYMSIKASQQSLGRKVSPADLLLALLSPHQTILAVGMVGLEFGIDVVSKLLRSRKIDCCSFRIASADAKLV
jgi:hypothetical protein